MRMGKKTFGRKAGELQLQPVERNVCVEQQTGTGKTPIQMSSLIGILAELP